MNLGFLPTKDEAIESLKIFGRRTRDIAVSGLADNIWKNQKLIDGAAVIKETLAKNKADAQVTMAKDKEEGGIIGRTLNNPTVTKGITKGVGAINEGILLGEAGLNSLRTDVGFREAYNSLKAGPGTEASFVQRLEHSLLRTGPQTAIGVALSFIPIAGVPLATAYWTAISADEQIKNKGKVTDVTDIGIDVALDSVLGSSIERMFKSSASVIKKTVQSALTEGGTEVTQSLLKFFNHYWNGKTDEERAQVIDEAKQYITSGDIAVEFATGAIAGGGIAAATSVGGRGLSVPPDMGDLPATTLPAGPDDGGGGAVVQSASVSAVNQVVAPEDHEFLTKFFSENKNMDINGIRDRLPDWEVKEDTPITDVHGEKVVLKEGEKFTPYIYKDGKVILQDGKTYVVSKNQAANIQGKSEVGVAKPFAQELEGTTEIVHSDPKLTDRPDLEKEVKRLKAMEDDGTGGIPTMQRRQRIENQLAGGPFGPEYAKHSLPGERTGDEELLVRTAGEDNDVIAEEEYGKPYDDLDVAERHKVLAAMPKGGTKEGNYQGGHYPYWNILFHLRMNYRKFMGKSVAFLEEAQSDWMLGFRRAEKAAKVAYDDAKAEGMSEEEAKALGDKERIKGHEKLEKWVRMAAKKFLLRALEKGQDIGAWTTGAQQIARYNKSVELASINWGVIEDGKKVVWLDQKNGDTSAYTVDKKGRVIQTSQESTRVAIGSLLEDVIEGEHAAKIMAAEKGDIRGEGLKIGGKAFINLYDKWFRSEIEDLTGGKVKDIDMGLPVGGGTASYNYADDDGTMKPVTPENIEVGMMIEAADIQGGSEVTSGELLVTEILEGGKFMAENAYEEGREEEFELPDMTPQKQPSIELTDRIKAKIRGENPVGPKVKKPREPKTDTPAAKKPTIEFTDKKVPFKEGFYSDVLPNATGQEILKDGKPIGSISYGLVRDGSKQVPFIEAMEVYDKGKGNGTDIIKQLFAAHPDADVILGDATEESVGFWRKMAGDADLNLPDEGGRFELLRADFEEAANTPKKKPRKK